MPVDYSHELDGAPASSGDAGIDQQWAELQAGGATGYAPGFTPPDFSHELTGAAPAQTQTQDFTDELGGGPSPAQTPTAGPVGGVPSGTSGKPPFQMPNMPTYPGQGIIDYLSKIPLASLNPFALPKPGDKTVGEALSVPGEYARGVLAGKPGEKLSPEALHQQMFSPEEWAKLTPLQKILGDWVLGIATDPTAYIGTGVYAGTLRSMIRGVKSLKDASLAQATIRALEGQAGAGKAAGEVAGPAAGAGPAQEMQRAGAPTGGEAVTPPGEPVTGTAMPVEPPVETVQPGSSLPQAMLPRISDQERELHMVDAGWGKPGVSIESKPGAPDSFQRITVRDEQGRPKGYIDWNKAGIPTVPPEAMEALGMTREEVLAATGTASTGNDIFIVTAPNAPPSTMWQLIKAGLKAGISEDDLAAQVFTPEGRRLAELGIRRYGARAAAEAAPVTEAEVIATAPGEGYAAVKAAAEIERMRAAGVADKDIPPGLLAQLRQDPAKFLEKWSAFPAEQRFWHNAPESNAVAAVDRHDVIASTTLGKMLDTPWAKERQVMPEAAVMDAEAKAVQIWKAGGKTPESLEQAIQSMPPSLQAEMRYRNSRIPIEQDARRRLGLPELPTVPSPYLPRLSAQESEAVMAAERSGVLTANLETGTKTFAKPRYFETMKEGKAAGVKYEDPYKAFLMREVYSAKLEATANMMDELKGKVLFNTPGEARMAGKKGAEATAIDGLPGGRRYYTPSRDEAMFLKQNLLNPKDLFKDVPGGRMLGSVANWSNTIFRNPMLWNPLPHVTKNMGYKYGLSGGQYTKMIQNGRAVWNDPALKARFDKAMPFDYAGETSGSLVTKALQDRILKTTDYTNLKSLGKGYGTGLLRTIGKFNEPSSKFIFAKADPFMKAARWKQYVDAGLSDAAAANHVTVDLIRYGSRSDLIDTWKTIPMNFFVQWRMGSLGATFKAMRTESPGVLGAAGSYERYLSGTPFIKSMPAYALKAGMMMAYPLLRPVRTVLFVGVLEGIRDMYEKATGETFHMPINYVTDPIDRMTGGMWTKGKNATIGAITGIQHPVDNFKWTKAVEELVGSAIAGPGFQGTLSRYLTVLKTLQDKAGWKDIEKMFWGITQTAESGSRSFDSWKQYQQDSDVKHLVDILKDLGGQIAFSAHHIYEPGNRRPHRPR